MSHASIHLHQRKRIHLKREAYPHPNPRVRFMDQIVLVFAFIAPFTSLPQIYQIWATHEVGGISVITWVLYALFCIPFLVYGIVHREKPLIVMYSLWIVMNLAVVVGAVMYG